MAWCSDSGDLGEFLCDCSCRLESCKFRSCQNADHDKNFNRPEAASSKHCGQLPFCGHSLTGHSHVAVDVPAHAGFVTLRCVKARDSPEPSSGAIDVFPLVSN
jgi:hypothetical protein